MWLLVWTITGSQNLFMASAPHIPPRTKYPSGVRSTVIAFLLENIQLTYTLIKIFLLKRRILCFMNIYADFDQEEI